VGTAAARLFEDAAADPGLKEGSKEAGSISGDKDQRMREMPPMEPTFCEASRRKPVFAPSSVQQQALVIIRFAAASPDSAEE
jgi:hypothetical protein